MKKRKLICVVMTFGLVICMMLTGCSASEGDAAVTETEATETAEKQTGTASSEQKDADTKETDTLNQTVQELMSKYAVGAGEYDGKTITLKRTEALKIELGYNPWMEETDIEDAFIVYQDADLKYPVKVGSYEYDDENKTLIMEPPYYGIGELESSEIDLSHCNESVLAENDVHGWGTLGQYYLAAYVDAMTGKKLEKPLITVLKVDAELKAAPQMVFSPTEDGYATFTWQEIPGAEGYFLFKINKDETGLWETASVYADVKQNSWSCAEEKVISSYSDEVLEANSRFVQFFISDASEEWMEENAPELLATEDEDIAYDEFWSEYYGVIAYSAQGCSSMSNLMAASDIAHMLPNLPARTLNDDEFLDVSGVLNMPAAMHVTMCDGSTAQKVMDYDFDSIEKDEEDSYFTIKAKGCQSPFTGEVLVADVNWETFEADVAVIKERQEKLKNKGGNITPELTIDEEKKKEAPEETKAPEKATEASSAEPDKEPESTPAGSHIREIEVPITANSALSEFIATEMLETNEAIDISAFPDAADTERVVDAFYEAQYQNPLVLGVRGGSIDTEKRILYVEYDFEKEVTAKKQAKIKQRLDEIIGEIITEDMTDAQKGNAINEWLCENAVYDNDALANAEEYSFTRVDEAFYDSFTAYGILADGVGVCASYSAAYKLLADAAGLDSVVVTGYLDGSVPHAWNKVKLDDEWYVVDATNNDNDVIQNALLNLSDREADGTLVEDDRFVMNANVTDYQAKELKEEHYRATGRYFEKSQIAGELAEVLNHNGSAMLRTAYDINDEDFFNIAQDTADLTDKSLNGFYWMGVIKLEE